MSSVPDLPSDVYFKFKRDSNWREYLPDTEDDDELAPGEREAVIAVLGFDPSELDSEKEPITDEKDLSSVNELAGGAMIPTPKRGKERSYLGNKILSPPRVKQFPLVFTKDRGQPCKQGEASARTGCIPASGEATGDGGEPSGEAQEDATPEGGTSLAGKVAQDVKRFAGVFSRAAKSSFVRKAAGAIGKVAYLIPEKTRKRMAQEWTEAVQRATEDTKDMKPGDGDKILQDRSSLVKLTQYAALLPFKAMHGAATMFTTGVAKDAIALGYSLSQLKVYGKLGKAMFNYGLKGLGEDVKPEWTAEDTKEIVRATADVSAHVIAVGLNYHPYVPIGYFFPFMKKNKTLLNSLPKEMSNPTENSITRFLDKVEKYTYAPVEFLKGKALDLEGITAGDVEALLAIMELIKQIPDDYDFEAA